MEIVRVTLQFYRDGVWFILRRQIDVKVDADGRVLEFAGKQRGAGAGWINVRIYLLSREMIQSIP